MEMPISYSIYSKVQEGMLYGKIANYYAEAHKENLSFDIPYNHIVAKYKFPDSPYYRADMSEEEREMAFYQERALLFGGDFQLNDPYALAGTGKDGNFDQAIDKAVQEKLNQKSPANKCQ